MSSKNLAVTGMTKAQLSAAGLLDAHQAGTVISTKLSKEFYGFSRKNLPPGIPSEPRMFVYSVSDYGETINLGAGFGDVWTVQPCPEGAEHGPACPIKPIYFYEEVVVDKTEHTPYTDQQIADCIMKVGAGLTADLNRARVGWFISYHNPPKADEIANAVRIYTAECQRLFNEGNEQFRAGGDSLKNINQTHRRAAAYLKQKVDWDRPQHAQVDCPGCAEPVRKGAIMHAVAWCGYVFDWPAAIAGGMKRLEDAPESVRAELSKESKAKPRVI